MACSWSRKRTDRAIDAEAAAWCARRDAGMDEGQRAELERWLVTDPRHAAAWRDFEGSWRRIDAARDHGLAGDMIQELARRRRARRWRTLAGGLGVAAALAVAWVRFGPPEAAEAGTVIVSKPERRALADGSVIELNRGAEIAVDFSAGVRQVHLLRGEAHFVVAREPARPFVVLAAAVRVRAIGTEFTVQQQASQVVNVVVTHGRISLDSVTSATTPAVAPVMAEAGMSIVAIPAQPLVVEPLTAEELRRRLAWRGPRIELNGTPLAQAAVVFNRESPVVLAIGDRELAAMRITGVFRADDAEGFAHLLSTSYGVQAQRTGNTITLRSAR